MADNNRISMVMSPAQMRQMKDLMNIWGENINQTIKRCILEVWIKYQHEILELKKEGSMKIGILKTDGEYKLVKNLGSGKCYLTTQPLADDAQEVEYAFAGAPGFPDEEAALAFWKKRFEDVKAR